eukprot:CAMPEP_0195123762 /NCGR_PEP_ID=MMETSP0448-20130528/129396_1 /TAXON_ID=66468 /ORGANISM="Heterocapsa triquestra, Strain CCMP 448" /LENGTH=45 /DNA_ID= /DNA_START= /DNA_END= /DNA_ORIENTATION=
MVIDFGTSTRRLQSVKESTVVFRVTLTFSSVEISCDCALAALGVA